MLLQLQLSLSCPIPVHAVNSSSPPSQAQVAYFTSRNTYEDGRRPSFEVCGRSAALRFTALLCAAPHCT